MPAQKITQWSKLALGLALSFSAIGSQSNFSNTEYVHECKQFDVPVPDSINCMEGEELPVHRTTCDESGNLLSKTAITNQNYEKHKKQCDHPALVQRLSTEVGCIPGARIQLKEFENGGLCAIVCRRTVPHEKPGYFNDVSMICFQPQNGATCFFNSKPHRSHKPHFTRPGLDSRWLSPSELNQARCVDCHDKGPFLITPNLGMFGKKLLKKRRHFSSEKYFIVGSSLPFSHPSWKRRYVLDEPNKCTSCHSIGAGKFGGCGYLRDRAVGVGTKRKTSCGFEQGFMPPSGHQNRRSFAKDLERIRQCCKDFHRDGTLNEDPLCRWKELGRPN